MEAPDSGRLQVKQPRKGYQKDKEEGDSIEDMIKKGPPTMVEEKEKEANVEDGPVPAMVKRSEKLEGDKCKKKAGLMQLSKEELLHLLSIMEGEVQVTQRCPLIHFYKQTYHAVSQTRVKPAI